jgi:hypothetical protein
MASAVDAAALSSMTSLPQRVICPDSGTCRVVMDSTDGAYPFFESHGLPQSYLYFKAILDGSSIGCVDGVDRNRIHNIVVSTGAETDCVTGGADVGDADCTASACMTRLVTLITRQIN